MGKSYYKEIEIEFNNTNELEKELSKYNNYKTVSLKKGIAKKSILAHFGFKPQKKYTLTILTKIGELYE